MIGYEELEGFPQSTVSGHAGRLVLGTLGGKNVVCMQGRIHLYEGVDPKQIRVPIYTMKLLGCSTLLITSAVGSMIPEAGPGGLVLLTDHINFQGRNPLVGENDPIGPRFPDMTNAYDIDLRSTMHTIAAECGIKINEGVYGASLGPNFETPAEVQM